jgi:hypothetical protein
MDPGGRHVTGSGGESTTFTPRPPPSAGRRTAIRGCSDPAIRLAFTLAETSTPCSGASTSAARSANCWKPMLVPGGQAAQANASGAADVSGDPR